MKEHECHCKPLDDQQRIKELIWTAKALINLAWDIRDGQAKVAVLELEALERAIRLNDEKFEISVSAAFGWCEECGRFHE